MSLARSAPAARALRRAAAAVALVAGLAGPAAAETLTDALVGAYKTSGLLDQNRALLRAADEDVAIAVSALYPILNYNITSTLNDISKNTVSSPSLTVDPLTGLPSVRLVTSRTGGTTTASTLGLTAQITLWDGGRNRLGIDAAKESVLAARESLRAVEQDVLLNAVIAYMTVLRDAEFVQLRQNNVRVIGEELRAAQDRFEVGEITRTDVSQAEAQLAEARSFLASAEGDLAAAREQYRAVVGRYPEALAQPPAAPRPADSLDAAQAAAVRLHPQVAEAQRNVTVSEINVLRTRAQRRPSIDLSGSASIDDDSQRRDTLSLSLSGPIYQGGRLDALYRQAVARSEASRAALLLSVEQVRQNAANAWSQLAVAAATLTASRQQVTAQQTAFEGTREEARLGARTTLDVLNAEQALLDARTTVVAASTAQYVASYQLLSAMGLMSAQELKLPVTIYDPSAYYEAVRGAPLTESAQGRALDRVLQSLGKD